MRAIKNSLIYLILCIFTASVANAGVYGDDFGKCLVRSATDADKQHLMEWIFSAIALNPELAPYTNIPDEKRASFDRNMAALFERLVADACPKEASDAFRYEGASAFATAFQLLGQVAGKQLFASPEVAAGSEAFSKLIDQKAIEEKIGIKIP